MAEIVEQAQDCQQSSHKIITVLWCVVSVCLEQMITAALLKIISTFMYFQLAMQESLSKLLWIPSQSG